MHRVACSLIVVLAIGAPYANLKSDTIHGSRVRSRINQAQSGLR